MNAKVELAMEIPHDSAVAWQALLLPRADYFGHIVHVQHAHLSRDGRVQPGGQAVLQPAAHVMKRIPRLFRGVVQPVVLEVSKLDDERLWRQDTVQPNRLVSGSIERFVDRSSNGSLIAIEANLAVSSLLDIFASRLPAGISPENFATGEMEGMLNNWAALAAEMATA